MSFTVTGIEDLPLAANVDALLVDELYGVNVGAVSVPLLIAAEDYQV